ncbi:MAG: DUF305 domain-containing protein, partial [Actinobacteria bacterium]|nr:DUF305 domain-containing protein [Actinomycetota bacterium]
MSKFLTISLVIIAFIAGIGIGYVITPQYSLTSLDSIHIKGLGEADRNVDLRYLDAMISHHNTAMELAIQAKNNSKRSEIIGLADEILKDEPAAIDELYEWKKDWYNDISRSNAENIPNLGIYDEKFDLRFLNALIAHHEEGIKMTKEIRLKSIRLEVLNNADYVES